MLTGFQERTHFDCGDFAIPLGRRAIETDAFESGFDHTHRDSISHPNATPVSSYSNIKSGSPERKGFRHYETETKPLDSKYDDGDKRSSEDVIKKQKLYSRERKEGNY